MDKGGGQEIVKIDYNILLGITEVRKISHKRPEQY